MLIVDDHPGFRAAAAAVVGSCPGFIVAGELATGEQAVDRIGSAGAALVLMDLGMPGIGGAEATWRIRATHPQVVIVLLSEGGAGTWRRSPPAAGRTPACRSRGSAAMSCSGRGQARARAGPGPADGRDRHVCRWR